MIMLTVKECFAKFVNNAEVVDLNKAIGEFIVSRAADTSIETDMTHGIEEFNKDLFNTNLIETEVEKDEFYAVIGKDGFKATVAEANEHVRGLIEEWLLAFTPYLTSLENPPVKIKVTKLHHEMMYRKGLLPRPCYGEFAEELVIN